MDKRTGAAHAGLRGFTLVELLVAISVLAIVAVLGWRGLDGIVRARVALTADLEQTRGMQLAFAQMQSDCAHIVNAADIGGRTALVAEDGSLTLVRTVFADDQPSRVQVIAYRLTDGVLTRRESAATRDFTVLDAAWQAAAGEADNTPAVVLQSGVAAMNLRTWATNSNVWLASGAQAPAPAPAAGAAGATALVTGLEVALQLRGRDSNMVKVFFLGAV